MTKSDSLSKIILENLGVSPIKIEETHEKQCDYLVDLEGDIYLIEAKLREDDKAEIDKIDAEIQSNGISISNLNLGKDRNTAHIIKNAKKQLLSTAKNYKNSEYFSIVLIIVDNECYEQSGKYEQIYSTLLGKKDLLIIENNNTKKIDCYYFDKSELYQNTDIDGAIVVIARKDKFCLSFILNNFSPKFSELKKSKIIEKFDKSEIIDPSDYEEAWILDSSFYKKAKDLSDRAKIDFLKNKYGIQDKVIAINFNSSIISLAVP